MGWVIIGTGIGIPFRMGSTTSEGGTSYGDAITITTPAQTPVRGINGKPSIYNNKPVIVK